MSQCFQTSVSNKVYQVDGSLWTVRTGGYKASGSKTGLSDTTVTSTAMTMVAAVQLVQLSAVYAMLLKWQQQNFCKAGIGHLDRATGQYNTAYVTCRAGQGTRADSQSSNLMPTVASGSADRAWA